MWSGSFVAINVICTLYVVSVTVSSMWMDLSRNQGIMVLSACFFLLSLFFEEKVPVFRYVQIAFLALFHWNSQLNWCQPLYMFLAFKECYRIQHLTRSIALAFFIVSIYSLIRISYVPDTLYNVLVTFFDVVNVLVIVFAVHYVVKVEQEKRSLFREKKHLSTHDPLTGLLNYQEYHRQLATLLKKGERFVLLIIDCIDLKSMNDQQGYQGGNRILIKMANYLRTFFSEAYIMAHYGGDEFAVVISVKDRRNPVDELTRLLVHQLPRELKIGVTYGYAVYPEDGETKDALISAAEQKLFNMKREMWLKKEEQELRAEKLRVVGELAAGLAHEIRNPLTTLRGFLQLSKKNNFDISPYYELMMQETERVSELTAEFLQFSKKHAAEFKVQALQDCIQRVVHLLESEATYLGHELHCTLVPTPVLVLIDKDKMVQLFINLVRNAFDAMVQPGTVTIRLRRDGEHGVIEVCDTGSGIPEERLNDIFNPFYTTKETGTGLGLSICYQIVHHHNGAIEVESKVGEGSTFTVKLPLAQNEQRPQAQSS